MKRIVLAIALLVGTTAAFAQHKYKEKERGNVPESVRRSWQHDHPDYTNNNWERHGNYWRSTYQDRDHNNRNVNVYYDNNGRMLQRYSDWDRNDLPVVVQQRVRTRYNRYPDYTVNRVERPGRGFLFQINLGTGSNVRRVYYDENGREVRYNNIYGY
jgi:hypothetical protein